MRALVPLVATLLVLAPPLVSASRAETDRWVAEQGKYLSIGGGYGLDTADCSVLPLPKIVITTKPAHGKVYVWEDKRIIPVGRPCAGKQVISRILAYTPNPGFHGTDRVLFDEVIAKDTRYDKGDGHREVILTVP
jgi:hypothetical protein